MGRSLFGCERNSGPENARSTWSRFRYLFSFPVFINKSGRKKDAVVDRTNLSPKFPLPPHRTNSRSGPDPFRAPPRLPDSAPDLLVARRELSIGTSFPSSLWFRRVPRLGFARVGFGPRFARLRPDLARGRRIRAWSVGFGSDCRDYDSQFCVIFLVGGGGPRVSLGSEVFDSYSRIR
jgi:hypothetical protein